MIYLDSRLFLPVFFRSISTIIKQFCNSSSMIRISWLIHLPGNRLVSLLFRLFFVLSFRLSAAHHHRLQQNNYADLSDIKPKSLDAHYDDPNQSVCQLVLKHT